MLQALGIVFLALTFACMGGIFALFAIMVHKVRKISRTVASKLSR